MAFEFHEICLTLNTRRRCSPAESDCTWWLGICMSDRKWRYVGASVQGTSHLSSGLPYQDVSRWISFETEKDGEVLVLAVADGAGSAVRAADGARLACDEFLTQVCRY